MISLNSNPSAKLAQNNLNASQRALTGNMQSLSTGLRINSAADDAAGLQIANRMQTQISAMGVAKRNAGDAISLAQTAEGAMQESKAISDRIRDLALQSANDTNTREDREAMQKEVEAMVAEINRIAQSTNHAGINLLDGSAQNMSFQIGAQANETTSLSIESLLGADLGSNIQVGDIDVSFTDGVLDSGFVLTVVDEIQVDEISIPAGLHVSDAVDRLNNELADIDVDITVMFDRDEERLQLVADEDEMSMMALRYEGVPGEDGNLGTPGVKPGHPIEGIPGEDGIPGDNGTPGFKPEHPIQPEMSYGHPPANLESLSMDKVDISTEAGAQKAIIVVDEALAQIDDERTELGAMQNRLEHTSSNLTSMEENLGVAHSGIMDADFAEETVEMVSNQMLMQAGTSVLAQAKGMPQYATMLL